MNTGSHSLLALCMGEEQVERLLVQSPVFLAWQSREGTAVKWGLLLGAESCKANCPGRLGIGGANPTIQPRRHKPPGLMMMGRDPEG